MSKIDCVILWVDGSDREWVKLKNQYNGNISKEAEDDEIERYRDFELLPYLFRGIEKYMPWIRNVYFVTCGQRPEWMNTANPRLKLIDHTDFIPHKYLPTFSSHPIEMNLHRIPGLSENFVYFNDDMFVLRKTERSDFFSRGLPCDTAVLNAIAMEKTDKEFRFLMPMNNIEIINKHFDKRSSIKRNFFKYFNPKYGKDMLRTVCLTPWIHFTGFYNYHFPYSLKKSVLKELWEKEPEVLDDTCSHRFRNSNDVNIWLALYWQYASGRFTPRSPKIGWLTAVSDDEKANRAVYGHIREQKTKLIVINDTVHNGSRVEKIKKDLKASFETILPNKSSFEI